MSSSPNGGRIIRSTLSSRARASAASTSGARPSRIRGWPSKAASDSGEKSRARGESEAREHSARGIAERAPGGILDLDAPTREFGGDAPRDGRIGRDQRRRLPGGLQSAPHRDRERERLLVLVVRDDQCDPGEAFAYRGVAEVVALAAPEMRRFGGAKRLAEKSRARPQRGRRRAERLDVLARDADLIEQPPQRGLRMAGARAGALAVGADHRPGVVVEVFIEVRQDDGALRGARDGADEARGRAVGAGRARDDRRAAGNSSAQRLDFLLHRLRGARRAIDEIVFGEPLRPRGNRDFEEVEGDAPIGIERVGDQAVEPLPRDALDDHIVDQRRQIARERERLRRARRDQRRLALVERDAAVGVDLPDGAAQRLAPRSGQPRQRQPPRELADGGPSLEARRVRGVEDAEVRRRLERAERRDSRQDEARRPARGYELPRERRAGALSGYVDRRSREIQRTAGGKAGDQHAREQRARQRRQEWRAGGEGEDVGGQGRARSRGGSRDSLA